MAAYMIFDVDVTDPVMWEEYHKLAEESLAPYKWKFLAFGGTVETLEGDWKPKMLEILEFESMEQAQQWVKSPAYTRAKEIRPRAESFNIILVEGV